MSKSNTSSIFRRVDVDQYDEDRYDDDEAGDAGNQGPNESEVMSLISSQHKEALLLVLNNSPAGSKSQSVKDKATNVVMTVLTNFKGDMDQTIKSLDGKNLDMLMKYIYRGFEMPSDNRSAILLTWHQKVLAVGGLGCIMRTMTDRKRV